MPHIPQGTTDTVALELFEPALDAALRPSPDYDVSRWLYVPNTYSEYRYILGTRGQKSLICVGINPSTAAPDALDPTLQSAQRIALNNGYDSFLMFNVYAQRATRPDDMERVCNSALHEENRKAFRYLLSDDSFKKFKKSLVSLIRTYQKESSQLTQQQLYDKLGFPSNWMKLTQYKR